MNTYRPFIVIGVGDGSVLQETEGHHTEVIALPGEPEFTTAQEGVTITRCQTVGEACYRMRNAFCTTGQIAMLAGAKILTSHPIDDEAAKIRDEWSPLIERRLSEFFDDLGNCPIDSWHGALATIAHGDLWSRCPTTDQLANAHAGQPAICIAAGPSGEEHLENIARIKGHVIFACDSMLDGCMEHGIRPDYVTMIERGDVMAKYTKRYGGCGTRLIASPVVHRTAAEPFGDHILWWIAAEDVYRWIGGTTAPYYPGRSSGVMSVAAAILAGCEPIYLVGHDLSYVHGRSHSGSVNKTAVEYQIKEEETLKHYHTERFEVPGNSGLPVITNGLWNIFRGDLELIIAASNGATIYNVNDYTGAVISGTTHCHLPEMGLARLKKMPEYQPSFIPSPIERIPRVLEDLAKIQAVTLEAMKWHAESETRAFTLEELDAWPERLTITKMVGEDNAWLFHYVFRSVYNNLFLRLHLHTLENNGEKLLETQRHCIRHLSYTLGEVCDMMRKDLLCLLKDYLAKVLPLLP